MSEVEEYLRQCSVVTQNLLMALAYLCLGLVGFAWASIEGMLMPGVLALGFGALSLFIVSRTVAIMRRGYNRALWNWLDEPTYPPLNEWEKQLEDKEKFAEWDWWDGT